MDVEKKIADLEQEIQNQQLQIMRLAELLTENYYLVQQELGFIQKQIEKLKPSTEHSR